MSAEEKPATDKPKIEFSLERLEHLAYTRQHEAAVTEMWRLLSHLETRYGQLGDIGSLPSGSMRGDERDAHFASRIAGAIAALLSDPTLEISDPGFHRLIPLQRWLAIVFGASPFGNADHVIRLLNRDGYDRRDQITFKGRDLLRFCLLFGPDSQIPLEPEALWQKNRRLAAALFFALLSPRIVVTDQAHAKREYLLQWLRPKLQELALDDFPVDILHSIWMSCSYAERPDKHGIKREIGELVRKKLHADHLLDLSAEPAAKSGKPIVLCILEWFYSSHAIYRTHSLAIEALKARYHVVGISLGGHVDDRSRTVFDELHTIRPGSSWQAVKEIRQLAAELRPAIVYYPSIGMFLETVFLAYLRLAPIQMQALGHPATTHSPVMDYVVVAEDFLGDPACFSERVMAVPAESQPFRPPANCPNIKPSIRKAADTVRIAVAATSMKINPRFLQTLREIAQKAKPRVEFHFLSGMTRGLTKVYMQNLINRYLLGWAKVYPELAYDRYLGQINDCDMFLNPFPFGNTNGIVDTVRQGLPGVCMTGPEVHTHIDEGLFERLGLPDWLVARTPEEYAAAALRLIDNHTAREKLSRDLLKTDPDAVLFTGNAALYAEAVHWVHRNHAQHMADAARLLRPPAQQRSQKEKKARGARR